jgi:transcriptional regulator with XRE-family HTH domain
MLVAVADLPLLAQYLRARREQVSPTDVGLRPSGRRRTPGLRREELATLAGVSIDYLVRLEQGRDTNPSPAVLASLADALRLTPRERHHLVGLAAQTNNPGFCPGGIVAEQAVPSTVRALLERLEPGPAFVTGPYGDVLAWTPTWERIAAPMGFLDDALPNLARFVFAHPAARSVYADWDAAADEQASVLRGASLPWRDDAGFTALLAELEAIPAFAERWSAHHVTEKRRGTKALLHPDLGPLQIDYEVLLLGDDSGQRLYAWLPADAATAVAFQRDAAATPVSPAQLRVVGEA